MGQPHFSEQQEALCGIGHYYALIRNYSQVCYRQQDRREDSPGVLPKFYVESMRVIAVDSPQFPLAARLEGSAIAEPLDAVVLVLRSYASIYKKLSCAFLISFIGNVRKCCSKRDSSSTSPMHTGKFLWTCLLRILSPLQVVMLLRCCPMCAVFSQFDAPFIERYTARRAPKLNIHW